MLPGVASEGIDGKSSDPFAALDRDHCNADDRIVNGAKKNGLRKSAGRFASFVSREVL
jgi:hypothetical protein